MTVWQSLSPSHCPHSVLIITAVELQTYQEMARWSWDRGQAGADMDR